MGAAGTALGAADAHTNEHNYEIGTILTQFSHGVTTFDVFLSVLLPAPSPAFPEAMAGATSMGGYLATARATQLVDVVR